MISALGTATALSNLLAQGATTSLELVTTYLDRIRSLNPSFNAIVCCDEGRAVEQARAADQLRMEANKRGESVPPWLGIPIILKDIICTRGVPTTCGSRSLSRFIPPYDATVVQKLASAGLIPLAKSNLDEFAMGGSTETSIFGSTRNPWDTGRTAGGSSGGSAAAVAANFAPVALGTDTGGSIRQPASFCGICGLKPTYGRVSRYGLIAFASSLDQIGPMAHTVEDLAMLLSIISGHDPRDSTSIDQPEVSARLAVPSCPQEIRVGIVREHLDHQGLHPETRSAVEAAMDVFRTAGAQIVSISLPHARYSIPAYYIIAPSEASSNLSRYDGVRFGHRASLTQTETIGSSLIDMYCRTRSEGFGAEVKRRIMLGTYALSSGYYDAYYLQALKVRRKIREDYDRAFEQVDVLLGPTTPGPAFLLGEKLNDPVQMYLEDLFTVGANLGGLPAISIPYRTTSEGLPLGLQFQAAPMQEERLLQIAHWFHQLVDYRPKTI